MEATHILLGKPWQYDRKFLHDGHTNNISFNFQGHKIILKLLSPEEVNEDQVKMKTKRENEKDEETNDKNGYQYFTSRRKNNHVDLYKNTNCTSKVLFFLIFPTWGA